MDRKDKITELSDAVYLACRLYEAKYEPSYYIYAHHILQWLRGMKDMYYMDCQGNIYYTNFGEEMQDFECYLILDKPLHLQPDNTIDELYSLLCKETYNGRYNLTKKEKRILLLKKKLQSCNIDDACNKCRVCKYSFFIDWANGLMNGESDITREPLIEEFLHLSKSTNASHS